MNTSHTIIAVVGTATAAVAFSTIDTIREERKRRAQIRENTKKEINAIHYAKDKMLEQINTVKPLPPMPALMNDFTFHKIVYHLEFD